MDTVKPLADALPYRQFLRDRPGVIDLRDDGILKGYWLVGPSPDSSDEENLLAKSEQLGASPVHLRTADAIQVVFDRRPAPLPPDLHYGRPAAALVMAEMRERFAAEEHWITPTRLYLSHQFEKPTKATVRATLDRLASARTGPERLDNHDLLGEHALGRFQAFKDSAKGAADLIPMSNVEMFRDLLYLVTYNDYPAALPHPHVRLNKVLACEWQVNGLYPEINGWHLRPLVITAYPSQTLPQMLSILLQHPGYLTLSIRYRCLTPYDAQKKFEKEKPFWDQTAIGDFIAIIKSFFGAKKENREHAFDQIAEIQEAINASKDGTSFGTVSCVAIVRDRDPREADAWVHNLKGLLNGKGVMARIETIGAAKAIETTWPGHLLMKADEYEANRLRIPLTGFNFWDLAIPAKYWEGTPYVQSSMYPPCTPTPLVCSGSAGEPFYFPTHVGGRGHMLGIGGTGSGKSTLAAVLACALQAIPDSSLTWLDLGHSSFVIAHLLGAEYHDVGNVDSVPLCPLALLDQPHGLQFLMGWFERLFFRRKQFELDENGSKDLRNALMDVRSNHNWDGVTPPRHLRRLYAALPSGRGGDDQRTRMRGVVNELIEDYAYIFGGEPPEASNNSIIVYELSNLDSAPKYISTPTKELILYNTIARLDGKPAACIWDEFWDAIGDDTSGPWFFRAIRTMRRKNCSFVGFTQSSIDITRSPDCNLLLGNMPGKLFFPDDSASTSYVAESLSRLGLNPQEISHIATAHVGEFFYKSSIGSRLASCSLGSIGQAICASTSWQAVEAMQELLKECRSGNLLDAWLAKHGIGVTSKAA
jgi:type IV secretion system protein VirB4